LPAIEKASDRRDEWSDSIVQSTIKVSGFTSSGMAVVLWQLRCVSFDWLLTTYNQENVAQSGVNGNARLPLGAAHHDLFPQA
jgi:hypothetical protein